MRLSSNTLLAIQFADREEPPPPAYLPYDKQALLDSLDEWDCEQEDDDFFALDCDDLDAQAHGARKAN